MYVHHSMKMQFIPQFHLRGKRVVGPGPSAKLFVSKLFLSYGETNVIHTNSALSIFWFDFIPFRAKIPLNFPSNPKFRINNFLRLLWKYLGHWTILHWMGGAFQHLKVIPNLINQKSYKSLWTHLISSKAKWKKVDRRNVSHLKTSWQVNHIILWVIVFNMNSIFKVTCFQQKRFLVSVE